MTQKELIQKIKELKLELRLKFSAQKLIELYNLIDKLED